MSRYYDILITDQGNTLRRYTSYPNGVNDPNALRVALDILAYDFSTPAGASKVSVMGVPFQDLGQALNLNGKSVQVSGGFTKGLPLANATQAGLLVQGTIFQAFGNWLGTEMSLDLILAPPTGSAAAPVNFVLDWQPGQTLATALASTLKTALPGFTQNINLSPNLVLSYAQTGVYHGVGEFALFIKQLSRAIVGGNYTGVSLTVQGSTIIAFDGTSTTTPRQLAFNDLIGQPTWLDFAHIQTTCAMRGDLKVSDFIKMPPGTGQPGTIIQTAQGLSQYRSNSVFQGVFQIDQLRHVGDSRLADARAWVTVIDAHPVTT